MSWFLLTPLALSAEMPPELSERVELRAQELGKELHRPAAELSPVLEREVARRLEGRPEELNDLEVLERTVVDYEAFRLSTYTRSGVSPKRYFGYLDERNDTAAEERVLKETVRTSTRVANAWLIAEGSSLRVTDQEILVTVLAEGGALWLGQDRPLHPIFDVGLDDIASGSSDLSDLRDQLDEALGTDLGAGDEEYSLVEAVAGTALMWVWEKQIAERQLRDKGWGALATRPLDEQFVISSLVYNCGDAHSPQRWRQLLAFETAEVIWEKSEANAQSRWRLPLVHPKRALDALISGQPYPYQGTDWLAMMHILQRWGAYEALSRFTEHFDEGGMLPGAAPGGSAREQQG